MTEQEAKEILGNAISDDNGLTSLGWYIGWNPWQTSACLDGDFTAEDLEAIAWWMRNKATQND